MSNVEQTFKHYQEFQKWEQQLRLNRKINQCLPPKKEKYFTNRAARINVKKYNASTKLNKYFEKLSPEETRQLNKLIDKR